MGSTVGWCVNFRVRDEGGPAPMGGFLWVSSQEERDDFIQYLTERDCSTYVEGPADDTAASGEPSDAAHGDNGPDTAP